MNSFPLITNDVITECFSSIRELYSRDPVKLLDAAHASTSGEQNAFAIIPGTSVDDQIESLMKRLKKTADGYGQKLLIKIIEHLYHDLLANGAKGVSNKDFLDRAKIILQDDSEIRYEAIKKWHWEWKLDVNGNPNSVDLDIRLGAPLSKDIVPHYILQYIQQAIFAFKTGKHAVAMSLIAIALEGTLRDALNEKGYSYQNGTPSQDVYEIKEMHVHKDSSGYKVTFPNSMPQPHTNYLAAPGDPVFQTYRIKRVRNQKGKFILEIRDTMDLLDYWSSDQITTQGVKQVGGLGAALEIGRNHLNIITPIDIPGDLDKPIQAIRNNLIHLSGQSMLEVVQQDSNGQNITLADFLNNKNRVFDAICSIGNSVNTIYNKIADGTL